MNKLSTLLGLTVLAATFATSATAATIGSIPGAGGATNDGLIPIYGPGTTERFGFYGANLGLFGAGPDGATLTFEYLGKEAGNTNTFNFQGVDLFTTSSNTWDPSEGDIEVSGVMDGLLDFSFLTSGGGLSVTNGSNPDDLAGESGVNFFATLVSNPLGSSGVQWDLWFDDQTQGDDNHDDMAIRITVRGATIKEVPAPAAGLLFLGGLGALVALRRRRKKIA